MPITVDLQDVYSYNKVAFIVAALLFVALCVVGIIVLIKFLQSKVNPKPVPPPVVTEPTPAMKSRIKGKYLGLFSRLEGDYRAGRYRNNERAAFEELSKLSRKFVRETTGIKVTNYTLEEIKKVNMPRLTRAIELCYPPEFSPNATEDFLSTISLARQMVETWT